MGWRFLSFLEGSHITRKPVEVDGYVCSVYAGELF